MENTENNARDTWNLLKSSKMCTPESQKEKDIGAEEILVDIMADN